MLYDRLPAWFISGMYRDIQGKSSSVEIHKIIWLPPLITGALILCPYTSAKEVSTKYPPT